MNKFPLIIFAFIFLCFIPSTSLAQCPTGRNIAKDSNTKKEDTVRFSLPANSRFYIKLDKALSSAIYKTGDIVQFTTLEDVYGYFDPLNSEVSGKAESKLKKDDLVSVIPKGSQVFGMVNYALRRTPFYVRGKAKIYVQPRYVIFGSGQCISLELPEPNKDRDIFYARNIEPCKNPLTLNGAASVDDVKLISKESKGTLQCIRGRRPNVGITSGLIGSVAGGALAIFKDDATTGVAGLTLINGASTGAGISDIINGTNADISDALIFEVQTTKIETGYTKSEVPKPEPKDEGTDKKKP